MKDCTFSKQLAIELAGCPGVDLFLVEGMVLSDTGVDDFDLKDELERESSMSLATELG